MEKKEYDLNSYRLHLIKSDKVKTCHIEVHFRDKVNKENIFYKSMLTDILSDCSNDYANRKEVVIRLEELYEASFYGTTSKLGGVVDNIFVYNFINPKYIKEKNYLKEAVTLLFDMIEKPKVNNKAFDKKMFEVVKTRAIRDVESVSENPVKLSINNALKTMDSESLTSVPVMGTIEDIENATSENLYKEYKNMINNSYCDVYVIGDIDFDEVYKIITSKFKINTIKSSRMVLNLENKVKNKSLVKDDKSEFVQSNTSIICNLDNLSDVEKNITVQVYNYIFGSGGLNSKLYQKVREENSLCYGIYSLYLKYDSLLIIEVSLDESNRKKAIKLIKSCLKEMEKGKISTEELEDAKLNLLSSLKMAKDNNVAILNNYIFSKIDNLPTIEERMDALKEVTVSDIKAIAKKVKINTVYTLMSKEGKQ